MDILEYLKENTLLLDGAMGTLLLTEGMELGEWPDLWNLSHPDVITDIHRAYFDAGSNAVLTNTFGACRMGVPEEELGEIAAAAVENARRAAESSTSPRPKWVGLDVGPCGTLAADFGAFIRAGAAQRPDFIFIETMVEREETEAALKAAKENCDMPVFVCNTYGGDGVLKNGERPADMPAILEALGADAVGVNCSAGPKGLLPVVEQYLRHANVPVIFKPNAGHPRKVGRKAVYDLTPRMFADYIAQAVSKGVRIVGGCCGMTPETIRAIAERI